MKRKAIAKIRQITIRDWGCAKARSDQSADPRAALRRIVVQRQADYPTIKHLRRLPVVVDIWDATSVRLHGSMRYMPLSTSLLRLPSYWYVRRIEHALIREAAHLLFASCRDRKALMGSSANRATVVPNGVDLDFWRRSSPERGRNTIIFTGAMHYAPNADAAPYLAEEIFPLVRRSITSAELLIVGRDPTLKLLRIGAEPGITVTGFVDDVRPYLDRATVFAAPLRFGAGIQNKLLEAMAMAVPVVASPLAADGLRTDEGESPPVQVAENRERFAELIIVQLANRARDPAPDMAARDFGLCGNAAPRKCKKSSQTLPMQRATDI